MNRAVFFDRDGIINKPVIKENRPYPPASLAEFAFNESIPEVCAALKDTGFFLFIFTNQPDVARGTRKKSDIENIHGYILKALPIDKIYTCYHDNSDNCSCRKPLPGMIYSARDEFNIDLSQSFAVGDRWRDVDAGKAAGVKTIFFDYGYAEELNAKPDYTIKSIAEILKVVQYQ